MMKASEYLRSDRLKAVTLTVAVQALLGLALVRGLVVSISGTMPEQLKVFRMTAPPLPRLRQDMPKIKRSKRASGAASQPNLRARSSQIVLPPSVIPISPVVVAAPIAGTGNQTWVGAADVRGFGTGSGGIGLGLGGGGFGKGDGDGGEDTPPRLIRGRLKDSDYPASAGDAGAGGTVSVRYTVGIDGRISRCAVTRSSGNADLDATTCRLIQERFRYRPSRDGHGDAVPSIIVEDHSWIIRREPSPDR